MTTELYTPLLTRVWAICTRLGAFPPPPDELIVQQSDGSAAIPPPQVTYSSKIALAIKGLENASLMNVMEMWLPAQQIKPEVFDNVSWDITFRDSVRNAGLPARWLMEADAVGEIREQRAAQQAEMQKKAEQMQMAEGASKLGSVKDDIIVVKALSGAMANGAPRR